MQWYRSSQNTHLNHLLNTNCTNYTSTSAINTDEAALQPARSRNAMTSNQYYPDTRKSEHSYSTLNIEINSNDTITLLSFSPKVRQEILNGKRCITQPERFEGDL